jgi:hypothetical protein
MKYGQQVTTYSTNSNFLGNILRVVNVHFVEVNIRVLVGKLLEDGRHNFARSAPRCPEVNYDNAV